MMLNIKDISVSMEGKSILQHINLSVNEGKFVGLVGPNGSGKSTLLKSIYRILDIDSGDIFIDGDSIYKLPLKDMAKRVAVVSQENSCDFDFTVKDIVLMGRSPHKKMLEGDTEEDFCIVKEALLTVGMEEKSLRGFSTLSGGEKQRVLIARALAQKAKLLILDEPTNHLDIKYQLQLMDIIKSLNLTVLSSLHDLNIASMYCDFIYVIKKGEIVKRGTPEQVINKEMLKEVFEVDAEIVTHPVTKRPYVIYFGSSINISKELGA